MRIVAKAAKGLLHTHHPRLSGGMLTHFDAAFQNNLANGKPNVWRCRAGSRYLYVDEAGLVRYYSQQRGVARLLPQAAHVPPAQPAS
jgi:hypothetical protein